MLPVDCGTGLIDGLSWRNRRGLLLSADPCIQRKVYESCCSRGKLRSATATGKLPLAEYTHPPPNSSTIANKTPPEHPDAFRTFLFDKSSCLSVIRRFQFAFSQWSLSIAPVASYCAQRLTPANFLREGAFAVLIALCVLIESG